MSDSIEELLREAYSTTHEMLKDPELGSVVKDGLLISYGPPIPDPDLLLLSFQGGGADQVVQKEWPKKLLYVDSPHRFGKTLEELCRVTGLYPGFPILGVFRLNGLSKRDDSIIVRSCKATQSPVYPIRDAILAVNYASCRLCTKSRP